MKTIERRMVWMAWRTYCVLYFRWLMAKHWMKGDIGFRTLWMICLPPRMQSRRFDFFNDLPHPRP